MSRKKKRSLKFSLIENDGLVEASLDDEYDVGFHHTISGMPAPRVRAPRVSQEDILYFSKMMTRDGVIESNETYLRRQADAMTQQINQQVHEIRKILKRTQSMVHYIKNVEELLDNKLEVSK